MNEIYNIRKLENLKEYLNQRMVSPRLLNNPRIYEILDEISDEFSLIFLDEEMKRILDEQILVEKDGTLRYFKDNKRVKIARNSLGIEIIKEAFDKEDSSVISEKRLFDNGGIEYLYEIREGNLSWEDFEKNIDFIPSKKIRYTRDSTMLNFIMKEEIGQFIVKKHLIQQVPYMLQNLKLTRKNLSRVLNGGTKIDDLCGFLTNSQAEFDTIKELFNENDESKGQEEIFKTYCSNNRRFQLPTTYENAVAKRLGISIEMAR